MTRRVLQAAMDFPMEVGHGADDRRFRREQRTKRQLEKAPLPDVTDECCLLCVRWMAPEREGERFGSCRALVTMKFRGETRIAPVEQGWMAQGEVSRLRTAPGFPACDSFEARDGSRRTPRTAGAFAVARAATGADGTPVPFVIRPDGLVAAVRAAARASVPVVAREVAGDAA